MIIAMLLSLVCYSGGSSLETAPVWLNDFATAKQVASIEDKDILLVFSGSDWCAPCIKLEAEIWDSKEFQNYAQDNLVLLRADFPRKKKNALPIYQKSKNGMLAEKYNPQGYFPLVLRLNKEGKVLGKTGYKSLSPTEYVKVLEDLNK